VSSASVTRALMAALRDRLGASDPNPPRVALPPVVAPPARVYVPHRPDAPQSRHTTALLGIGHVGTRYATDVVLQFQAELAVAHAAVGTLLPENWAQEQGFVAVKSRVTNHREFLLRPDLGRRLDDESLEQVRTRCKHSIDVQIIVADGLSAVACMQTGKQLAELVERACQARGLTTGTIVAARFARVWLEDEIGQEVGAKVAIMLLGERPGLGTGDGLSAYVVYSPKVGNTDGDRNMISNIHLRGIVPADAAQRLASFAAAMIAQRKSGVELDLSALGESSRAYREPQVRQRLVTT
jgi:ethanolamine ammonia-lyase small subunit